MQSEETLLLVSLTSKLPNDSLLIPQKALAWGSIHLPFIMSYILAAGALSKLVVATDLPDADSHDLTHFYEEKSEDHVAIGLRWFYCVGLGIALTCMGKIAILLLMLNY